MDGQALFNGSSRARGCGGGDGGLSCNQAAKQFGVAISTAINWVRRPRDRQRCARQDGRSQAEGDFGRTSRCGCCSGSRTETSPCAGWWSSSPSAALRSITARCGSSYTPRSSASKKSVVAGERDRPDVARRRAQWTKYQGRIEPERLVFIDETWTKDQHGPTCGDGRHVGAAPRRQGPARPLEDDDLRGRAAHRSDRCALAARRADRWRELSHLR